ncbi:hypothetical protein FDECE_2725 [Fusarium decemcellulare]|nr:hypothetical protein FDECE_2725 [Fusarium decemcellulare]
MKLTLSLITLSALLVSRVAADFDVYMEYNSGVFWNYSPWAVWQEPPTNCATRIFPAPNWLWKSDVSGKKLGVRCKGKGCGLNEDAHGIRELEMHFSNNPLYHWTIYLSEGASEGNMQGLDEKTYGVCHVDQDTAKDYACYQNSGGQNIWRTGFRKFHCVTKFTADDILATA